MSLKGKFKNTLEHLIFNLDHMMLKSHKTQFLLSEQLTSPDPTLDNANWSIFDDEKRLKTHGKTENFKIFVFVSV